MVMLLLDDKDIPQFYTIGLEHFTDIHEDNVWSYMKDNILFCERIYFYCFKTSNRVLILFKVHKIKYL